MRISAPPVVRLPDAPALVAGVRGAVWVEPGGAPERLSIRDAAGRLDPHRPPLVCHAKAAARRLNAGSFRAFDLLELFAFVRPAQFCLPTVRGLAQALGLPLPATPEQEAAALADSARVLLEELTRDTQAGRVAWSMARGGWPWGPSVLAATGAGEEPHSGSVADGLRVWNRLGEWAET